MLDTFKVRLKAKSTAAGANLSQKRIDALADRLNLKFPDLTDEAAHDSKIDDLYDVDTLKDFASVDDYQRAKEKREAEKKKDPEKKEEKKTDPEKKDDTPEWAKALIQQNQALTDRLNGIEKEKTLGSIKQKATEKLKDVPASYWAKRTLPEKEEDLDAFITEVSTDYTAFKQDLVNQGLAIQTKPGGGNGGGGDRKMGKEEIKVLNDSLMPK